MYTWGWASNDKFILFRMFVMSDYEFVQLDYTI